MTPIKWRVEYDPRVAKALARMAAHEREAIFDMLEQLQRCDNPTKLPCYRGKMLGTGEHHCGKGGIRIFYTFESRSITLRTYTLNGVIYVTEVTANHSTHHAS